MKPILMFAYGDHYPAGGTFDIAGTFDSVDEAIGFVLAGGVDPLGYGAENIHLLDTRTGEITHVRGDQTNSCI
jgi:hypothetical protein